MTRYSVWSSQSITSHQSELSSALHSSIKRTTCTQVPTMLMIYCTDLLMVRKMKMHTQPLFPCMFCPGALNCLDYFLCPKRIIHDLPTVSKTLNSHNRSQICLFGTAASGPCGFSSASYSSLARALASCWEELKLDCKHAITCIAQM